MFDDGTEIGKEKHNFLAAYHALKFSKTDKDDIEVVDIERRCLATKYLSAKQFDSKDMALCLLHKGLEDYQSLMENKNGVNNYWKQFKALTPNINNDPQKWASSLNDLSTALDFVKPLPCQKDNTMPCHKRVITDKTIEKILKLWQNKDQTLRNRKVNTQGKSSSSQCLSTNEKLQIQNNNGQNIVGHSSITSTIVTNRNDSKQVTCTNRQVPQFDQDNFEVQNQVCEQPNNFDSMSKSTLKRGDSFNQIRTNHIQFNASGSNAKLKAQVCPQSNEEERDMQNPKPNYFQTANAILKVQQMKANKPAQKKTLGGKGSVNAQFACPLKRDKEKGVQDQNNMYDNECTPMEMEDDRLKNIEPKMVELIKNEIMDSRATICWDDIAGLESAKKIIMEVVVYPMLRPDIFTGLRRPPKGILLFGPPGTGKTLIGKCIASQSKSTFFSISASSLTSKWIGEGEKMVRALFAVARVYQPSVIFVDEIDSLLTQRSETEHESSRRLKTEFLVQLDGAATSDDDRILIVGATNRPHELDEAARRRLVKRLYVPLPELEARKQIIDNLLLTVPHNLTEEHALAIAQQSKGYSGADMSNLCKEASMGPIRSIPFSQLENIRTEDVRQVTIDDFRDALINVRPSVSESSLSTYIEWDSIYGSGTAHNCKI